MKRLGSSDSLGGLMSICPNSEERSPKSTHVYSREFQTMLDGLDEEGGMEELGHVSEKKRRLSVEQVKALEKSFEVENKLEPDRKVKLAQEIGLQPRQVAVWFQNRRARWKTKQLERDYGVLKANYDNLKLNFESLQRDNETLHKEINELKGKLGEENRGIALSVKVEEIVSEAENGANEENEPNFTPAIDAAALDSKEMDYNNYDDGDGDGDDDNTAGLLIFPGLKDGSSDDSDSSAILNENPSPNAAISSSWIFQSHSHLVRSPTSSSIRFNCSSPPVPSSTTNYLQVSDSKMVPNSTSKMYHHHHHQPVSSVKIEEHNFFNGEEACNFFSDEQAPSLHWYCPDQWN